MKRYKDTLKASLKDFNIPTEPWEQAAQDRKMWRCLINKGAAQFKRKRKERFSKSQTRHSPNSRAL